MTVAIVDLADRCDQLAARNRHVFETLGAWVADEPDAATQRWFSAAAHRHAWHADLWAGRRPAIPVDTVEPPTPPQPGGDRVAWYLAALDELTHDAEVLTVEVDAELDPSTSRVVRLVSADLDDLARLAPAG